MTDWYDNVPAPTDANGELVPLDTKELVFDGERRDVLRIAYSVSIGRWVVDLANTDEHPFLTHCSLPDSLERIADELDEQAGSLTKDGYTWQDDAIHDFADRIRKLRGED